jgi:hypothetical protein
MLSVYVCLPIQFLNTLTEFHEMRYERHVIREHPYFMHFKFLPSTITTSRMHEFVRWNLHHSHVIWGSRNYGTRRKYAAFVRLFVLGL